MGADELRPVQMRKCASGASFLLIFFAPAPNVCGAVGLMCVSVSIFARHQRVHCGQWSAPPFRPDYKKRMDEAEIINDRIKRNVNQRTDEGNWNVFRLISEFF